MAPGWQAWPGRALAVKAWPSVGGDWGGPCYERRGQGGPCSGAWPEVGGMIEGQTLGGRRGWGGPCSGGVAFSGR